MNFTTPIPISKSNNPLDYNSKIMSFGSCFAENMAEKFEYYKFQNEVNPFGIIFNPVSIEKLIMRIVNHNEFTEEDVFYHKERWHCFEVHSELSNSNKKEFLIELNKILEISFYKIFSLTHCIITYGTSWVYSSTKSLEIVANCHKVPQSAFVKRILSVESIEKSIQKSIDLIKELNPKCTFIFTISPVRHIKDGFIENQQSKAQLISAIHATVKSNLSKCTYFPSYEIMMDELRDYRFYNPDMLHPNLTAINYIWERFSQTHISEEIYPIMDEVFAIQKALLHRPFNFYSKSHQVFLSKLQNKIITLQQLFPSIRF